jgi:glutamyl-tRNA synthetase/nondiscriminating glutamyl-tRNA synthetase
MGVLPEAMLNYMALLGWAHEDGKTEILPGEELVRCFSLERVSKSPAVFDLEKLYWINRHYMKECRRDRLLDLALPFFSRSGLLAPGASGVREWIGLVLEAELNTLNLISELPARAEQLARFDAEEAVQRSEVQEVLAEAGARKVIQALREELVKPEVEPLDNWKQITANVKIRTGQKGKNLFHPIRVALTGFASGREMDKLIAIFEIGSRLNLPLPVKSCRQRVAEFWQAVQNSEF